MKITFHGAARTVTGSKHLLEIHPDKKILLDCGMFQGLGKGTADLNAQWGFEIEELSYVIISHAHVDHVGLLPKLVRDGYKGKIYCTTQTKELANVLMLDSAHIHESDAKHINHIRQKQGRPPIEPLYTVADAEKVLPLMVGIQYDEPYRIDDTVELLYTDCGHILGSAAVNLKIKEDGEIKHLTFSGDIGRYKDMILRSPEPFPQADFIIMESTYGNKLHEAIGSVKERLLNFVVHTCMQKKGKLIIPAFSVGRTQEILYLLNQLYLEHRLPRVNYYVDSPLSIEATDIMRAHPECYNDETKALLQKETDIFNFPALYYLKTAEESKELNSYKDPCVIISASGMAEAGRVKHHIANTIDNERNTILIVGYCEPHSLGGMLRNGKTEVTIFGEKHEVAAEVGKIECLSAHADYEDLTHWLSCQNPAKVKKLILVHGDYEVQQDLQDRLLKKGFRDVEIPAMHQTIGLG